MPLSILQTIKWIFFRKKADPRIVKEYKTDFQDLLPKVEATLISGNHFGQARVIATLRRLLDENNMEAFITELQSVNMWGGSGAVWEVGFQDEALEIKFAEEMIKLIDLMKQSEIDIHRSNSVRKLFVKQLST